MGTILQCPEILEVDMSRDDNMFSKPVKHFPKQDLWGPGVDGVAPAPDELTREDGDDEGVPDSVIEVNDPSDEADAAEIFGRLVQQGQPQGGDGVGVNAGAAQGPSSHSVYREICTALKAFNSTLIKAAQDRKYRFQLNKMFHAQGKSIDDADKWDYYSDDDDVLLAVDVKGRGEELVMGNIEEIIVCNEAPPQDNLLRGDALRRGQPKPRVAVNFHPERVVMLIRTYDEVDSSGNILTGYSNRNCKYFHLPLQCYNPLDYYSSRAVLGHVRLKPIQKIKRKEVSRMYQETHACDRRDLERKYYAE